MFHTSVTIRRFSAIGVIAALSLCTAACGGSEATADSKPIVGLITKTDTNPFFVKMKEGAQQAAQQQGIELQTFAG